MKKESLKFEDHFSAHAGQYAASRPGYPIELFDYLATLTPDNGVAWDCGTGNGQAALSLTKHFNQVIATDPSVEQIKNAFSHPKINYRVEPAESTSIEENSISLITSGTAAHWFSFDEFYTEVQRVSKSDAIIALWVYHLPEIEPEVDRTLTHYFKHLLDGYWPERIEYLDKQYTTIPFPFPELKHPAFYYRTTWSLLQLLGFLNSWSGTQRYLAGRGEHPLDLIREPLRHHWGTPEDKRNVTWQLHLRLGRVQK